LFRISIFGFRISQLSELRKLSTITYKALFHAALLLASQRNDQNEIDLLVTGLPVSQYFDVAFRQKLQTRLTGVHQVTPQIEVNVPLCQGRCRLKVMGF